MLLIVITGPIASGKSTIARAVMRQLEATGAEAAVVDLDLVYEMVDPTAWAKTDQRKWTQTRRVTARLSDAFLAEGLAVIVEGGFQTPAERREFSDALRSQVEPHFVTLRVSFDLALQRAQLDPTRGLSKDPEFLRQHYEATAAAASAATDLALDTGATSIAEAARVVAQWALTHREAPNGVASRDTPTL